MSTDACAPEAKGRARQLAPAKLSRLRVDAEFERLTTRATLMVDGIGIIGASLGDSLGQSVGMFQEEIRTLA